MGSAQADITDGQTCARCVLYGPDHKFTPFECLSYAFQMVVAPVHLGLLYAHQPAPATHPCIAEGCRVVHDGCSAQQPQLAPMADAEGAKGCIGGAGGAQPHHAPMAHPGVHPNWVQQ